MALSANTPRTLINPNLINPIRIKIRNPKPPSFSNKRKPLQISSAQPQQQLSLLLNNSLNRKTPNSHLHLLCINAKLQEALKYLESMQQLQIPLDEDAAIAMVRLCEWKRAFEEGSKVYFYISNLSNSLSLRLGNALLGMFVRFGKLGDAWYVFGKMLERDVFSWNVLISGYAKKGFFDEALCLYHRMLWVGFKPDVYTFPCVLRTCGAVPNLERGKEIHVHVIRFGFEADVDVVNALMTMYVKCGDLPGARLLFDKMSRIDRISWNAIISGYFENGECLEGIRLFFKMREHRFDPDLMTMTSVISACESLGDERLGREIHGYVVITGMSADVWVCNSLIQIYSSFGCWETAEKVFDKMEWRDVVSWTAMISGYENNEFPDKAVDTYRMMEEQGFMPDEVTLASVLSAYAWKARYGDKAS
ncbi:Pentatricopeptide repeat-containing protein [Hibiscus syriacus]|uniref:Pentatricopeptide repeat-containing protein n=1 Tax=Hibiscus syriacus TaxID=106335 RepID=A0A6A3B0G4_HIBSY|nr:Pentatricopeptide repeat-containing protein [Hibiscus syriacus]